MRTEPKTTTPLLLTSQYCEGDRDADCAALDAADRDWYRYRNDYGCGLDDQDVPEWPACVTCGRGVDWINEPHWHHAALGERPDLFVHDDPQCVLLVYPKDCDL